MAREGLAGTTHQTRQSRRKYQPIFKREICGWSVLVDKVDEMLREARISRSHDTRAMSLNRWTESGQMDSSTG